MGSTSIFKSLVCSLKGGHRAASVIFSTHIRAWGIQLSCLLFEGSFPSFLLKLVKWFEDVIKIGECVFARPKSMMNHWFRGKRENQLVMSQTQFPGDGLMLRQDFTEWKSKRFLRKNSTSHSQSSTHEDIWHNFQKILVLGPEEQQCLKPRLDSSPETARASAVTVRNKRRGIWEMKTMNGRVSSLV